MSSEIQVPFALDRSGAIAATTDPNVQAQQHVDSLISTTPGERVMKPTYGVDLTGMVFAPNTSELSAMIMLNVRRAFSAWEPGIQLDNVSPVPPRQSDPLAGSVQINVDWSIPGQTDSTTQSGVTLATILPGGSVIIDQQVISQ
jgi:phage baseplate assembly protein W